LISVGDLEKLLLFHYQSFAEKFNVIASVKTWARYSLKKRDMSDEISIS
jgi:hypothetical protein